MRARSVYLFLGIIIVAFWLAYRSAFPATTIRYHVDVNFELDGEPVKATGTWQVSYEAHPTFEGTFDGLTSKISADAAFGPITGGGFLFISVSGDNLNRSRYRLKSWNRPDRIPLAVLGLHQTNDADTVRAIRAAAFAGETFPLEMRLIPKIWILPDMRDLESFFQPTLCETDQACRLRFISGQVTFTNAPQETRITQQFPWLLPPRRLATKQKRYVLDPNQVFPATYMFARRS
jgi:hypothetical protein